MFILMLVFSLVSVQAAERAPHAMGCAWPLGAVPVRVEAGVYSGAVVEALGEWNAVLGAHGVRLVVGQRVRKSVLPRLGDKESTVYLTTATPAYADAPLLRRGAEIVEADVRINPDRFAELPQNRVKLILLHEIGHVLGFGHWDGPEASVLHSRLPAWVASITDFDRASAAVVYGGAAARAGIQRQMRVARRIQSSAVRNARLAVLRRQLEEM